MRIACPNCSAEYEVPDSLLAAGPRLMRCTRCHHQFQAGVQEPPPPPEPPPPAPVAATSLPEPVLAPPALPEPLPPPPAMREPPAARVAEPPVPTLQDRVRAAEAAAAPRTGAPLAAAWALSFAMLGAVGWAGYRYQAEIVEAWPPAARFYQAVGHAVGLE